MSDPILSAAFSGRAFRYFESTPSTMQEARHWIQSQPDLPRGAVVIADEQTAGRGRGHNTWQTPSGQAIAMSLIFKADIPPEALPMLSGVAIVECLRALLPDPAKVALKWPNDVLIEGRKVAGILGEALWSGDKLQASILGIGLNVTVDFSGSSLSAKATSLSDHLPEAQEDAGFRVRLMVNLLNSLDQWRDQLLSELIGGAQLGETALWRAWRANLSSLGQQISLRAENATFQGLALDVGADGALILRLENGEKRRFLAGEVTLYGAAAADEGLS